MGNRTQDRILRLGMVLGLAMAMSRATTTFASLTDEEIDFEKGHPLSAAEFTYEPKAVELYDANANYAEPDVPTPGMSDLLDRIFATYQSTTDYQHDLNAYQTWMNRVPNVVAYFDRSLSNYTKMQSSVLGLKRMACNYTVSVVHSAVRDGAWLQGSTGMKVPVQARAADYDDYTAIDRKNPRGISNTFNGVPLVGAQSNFLHVMKSEFVDNLIQYMNFKHLNSLPLYFVVNREPLQAGHPGHVFLITGIKRTGRAVSRSSFTFQMRQGSLDEVYWQPRTRDAQVDVFMNSPQRYNLLVPTQAFAYFYGEEMDTRFVIRQNQHVASHPTPVQPQSSGDRDFDNWFSPTLQ